MELRPLGRSDLKVTAFCLGTMTFGEQNDEAQSHAIMDAALGHGVTFFDAAEMYPIPPRGETQGRTEEYIGSWFAARGNRHQVVLATKAVGGPRAGFEHIRGGRTRADAANLNLALEGSLRRLRTDYIDLYQLHWPDRQTNNFGRLGFTFDPTDSFVPAEETLRALQDMVASGKVRHFGLSNETPWGVMSFLRAAEMAGLPRVVSIQNPYHLLNRSFEVGLAEMAIREQVGLLAYSPLAAGLLSGKYQGGARPAGARMTLWPERYGRYTKASAVLTTARYLELAKAHGLKLPQMALAYVMSRPFVTSVIFGVTSLEQLEQDLPAASLTLPEECLKTIEIIHNDFPNPCV